jgi:hypothetical protein
MPTSGNRPFAVPNDFVVTPFGYFHPSCVASLSKGERILPDRRIAHADGSVEEEPRICNSAHYLPDGTRVAAGAENQSARVAASQPEVDGWLENANVAAGSPTSSFGALIAWWQVPPQPRADDGQVLFFFPGLEDINQTQSILQPVLAWSNGQWSIASWNCCLSGIVVVSPAVNVSPGDLIYGSITNTCGKGTLMCSTWNVLSVDVSTGRSTTLSDTPSDGQVFNWAFGGVLEPYFVNNCDDFPRDGRIRFENITLFDQNLQRVRDPAWSQVYNSTVTPQCGYGTRATPSLVTLYYGKSDR